MSSPGAVDTRNNRTLSITFHGPGTAFVALETAVNATQSHSHRMYSLWTPKGKGGGGTMVGDGN